MNKRNVYIVAAVVAAGLFALLVLALLGSDSEQNNVMVVSPVGNQNVSGTILINITNGDRLPQNVNITNVTVTFRNFSHFQNPLVAQFVINDSDQAVNLTFNKSTRTDIAAAGLRDGRYNISVKAYNVSDDRILGNNSSLRGSDDGGIFFTIDNTFPGIIGKAFNASNQTGVGGAFDRGNASHRHNYTNSSSALDGINFNLTLLLTVDNSTGDVNNTEIHRVTFQISNGTGYSSNSFNVTAVGAGAAGSAGGFGGIIPYNYSLNISVNAIAEGNHSIVAFVNDTAGNLNRSVEAMYIIVDNHAPFVSTPNISEAANISDTTPTFDFQVNDSWSNTMSCEFILNSQVNISRINATNGTITQFSLERALPQGSYNWSISCNDTVRLNNVSIMKNFTIDTSGPSVSLSKSASSSTSLTIAITATADSLACTSSRGAATVTGAPGASQTLTETGLTAGTSYTYVVSCTDTSGNVASGSITLTTDAAAASSGGSGSGGSGGGISSGATGQFEKKVWASILAGEKATVAVANGVLGVTSIEFVVEKTTYGATMQVKKVDSLPSSVKAFSDKKYKTLEIVQTNVDKVLSGNALINFKVEKKWLADNNLASNAVVMFHYKDNAWVELKTTVGQDDGTYVRYTAETPGFSYFVIGEKSGVAAPLAEKKAAPSAAPTDITEPSEAVAEEVTAEEPSSSSAVVWVVVVLVLVGLLAWVVMALRRRR